MQVGLQFRQAFNDFLYLTEKGYPPRGFLKLVGDHYQLSDHERSMLYRGIVTHHKAEMRLGRSAMPDEISGKVIHVDGFNVLATISSYLLGRPVFIALDGFLRDASRFRGNLDKIKKYQAAINCIEGYLENRLINTCIFYLDSEVSFHEEIVDLLSGTQLYHSGIVSFLVSGKVDEELCHVKHGYVATSDSEIIDLSEVKIFDLAKEVLTHHFHPDFFDLRQFSV